MMVSEKLSFLPFVVCAYVVHWRPEIGIKVWQNWGHKLSNSEKIVTKYKQGNLNFGSPLLSSGPPDLC